MKIIYKILVYTTLIHQEQLQQDLVHHRILYLFLETSQTTQSTSEFTLSQNTSHKFYKAATVN